MRIPRPSVIAAWSVLFLAECIAAAGAFGSKFLPKVNSATWEGWGPTEPFERAFASWPDLPVPEDIQVWCKGFIPQNASTAVIGGWHTMPVVGPGGVPIPGLLGQCAATDGRSWSGAPPVTERPTDARFWGVFSVAGGRGDGVAAIANCGPSHHICCDRRGCWGGKKYGEVICEKTCDDSMMQVLRVGCWPLNGTRSGPWPGRGQHCSGGPVTAAKAYIKGRAGNPCGRTFGVRPPAATWDVGMAIFPTKRKVVLTGFVDEAPSYECYARAKDHGAWGAPVTLAQLPENTAVNIAIALAGFSDRPVNPTGRLFDLPRAAGGGAVPVIKPPPSALAAEMTGAAAVAHGDCWYNCGRKAGWCDWCGAGMACCRGGFDSDPAECSGTSMTVRNKHHECVPAATTRGTGSAKPVSAAAPTHVGEGGGAGPVQVPVAAPKAAASAPVATPARQSAPVFFERSAVRLTDDEAASMMYGNSTNVKAVAEEKVPTGIPFWVGIPCLMGCVSILITKGGLEWLMQHLEHLCSFERWRGKRFPKLRRARHGAAERQEVSSRSPDSGSELEVRRPLVRSQPREAGASDRRPELAAGPGQVRMVSAGTTVTVNGPLPASPVVLTQSPAPQMMPPTRSWPHHTNTVVAAPAPAPQPAQLMQGPAGQPVVVAGPQIGMSRQQQQPAVRIS